MATNYLPDATNFADIPLMAQPTEYYPAWTMPCPKCHGHGKWNLRLNAYGPKPGDASGTRQHFQMSCGNCWGWGWVDPASTDASCLHTFTEIAPSHNWRCWHTIQCTQCGVTRSYSSDD